MATKVLITGIKGQLGHELSILLTPSYDVVGVDIDQCDITNLKEVDTLFHKCQPEIVLHAAAYTDVDGAESNQKVAFAVNEMGTSHIANACKRHKAYLVYYSTDYVFDGTKERAYIESDATNPKTVYGQSKLAGERAVTELCSDAAIVRLAWLYGAHGSNFVHTIIRLALSKSKSGKYNKPLEALRVVDDQYGNPTWTSEVARQTETVIKQRLSGILHCTAEQETTWFQFAQQILKLAQIDVTLEPCSTEEFTRPAPRPVRSTLENGILKNLKINQMRPWSIALEEYIALSKEQLVSCSVK